MTGSISHFPFSCFSSCLRLKVSCKKQTNKQPKKDQQIVWEFYVLYPPPHSIYGYTPNCNNVVVKKWKQEKANNKANKTTFSGWIHLQLLHLPAGFFLLFFSFKTITNSSRQIWRPCSDAANEFTRLISLINSYLAFSFFHFSNTTLLQLGIHVTLIPSFFSVLARTSSHSSEDKKKVRKIVLANISPCNSIYK